MLEKRKAELYRVDKRGTKSQIREPGIKFDGVEAVTCPAGQTRGRHYHEGKNEYMQVFSGKVKLELEFEDGECQELALEPGVYVVIPPMTKHRVHGIEDSVLVIPFQGSSSIEDSHRWE